MDKFRDFCRFKKAIETKECEIEGSCVALGEAKVRDLHSRCWVTPGYIEGTLPSVQFKREDVSVLVKNKPLSQFEVEKLRLIFGKFGPGQKIPEDFFSPRKYSVLRSFVAAFYPQISASRVFVTMDRLSVVEEGQEFSDRFCEREAEREAKNQILGKIVLCLPSAYTGGEICFQNTKDQNFHAEKLGYYYNSEKVRWFAIDKNHKFDVNPVVSGSLVLIILNCEMLLSEGETSPEAREEEKTSPNPMDELKYTDFEYDSDGPCGTYENDEILDKFSLNQEDSDEEDSDEEDSELKRVLETEKYRILNLIESLRGDDNLFAIIMSRFYGKVPPKDWELKGLDLDFFNHLSGFYDIEVIPVVIKVQFDNDKECEAIDIKSIDSWYKPNVKGYINCISAGFSGIYIQKTDLFESYKIEHPLKWYLGSAMLLKKK